MSEEDAGQEKRKRLINNFTKLKNFPIRPPSGRSDSRSSTRSLELGCGVMYERDCRSAASDRPTTSQWEKRQKAEAKFKESQWQNGITDWYCPQPGEELEFYLGRVSCLLERCNKGNPNVEDLRTFRKWDSFGRVGFMEDVEDSEQIASCLEPENDSELQSDIETNRDSSVSSLSEMENQYEEPPEHITLLKKQDKVKQIESAFSVSMKDEPKTQGGNTEVVEPKPAVDELICSISRELIDIRFDKPAASPNIAEPSESEISMSMPISENNQKEADLSTKPSQPEAALCSIRPLLPSPSQRPSRVAKLNWKSRLENYGVFESSSKRASSVADTKLMTFFVDRYVNYMQRVGKPVERQLVESVLEPLKDAESNRTLMSENHPVEKASMKKKMKAESREMTSSSMSFVKNKAVAKRKSVKNDSNLSASTPYDPGWRNGLPSAKSKTHLDRFSVNRRLIQRFPVKKVLSTEKKSSRRENTTALGAPQSSLHHQQMTDSLAAKTIEDTSDRDTNSRCSSVSTIESFYSASDSPLKEGFGMRTVDEQSALTALIVSGLLV